MTESSFLSQLEQRTQQVKITLANLEAERTRIETLIGQLQPLVPQYDALIAAERTINDAQIELSGVGGESQEQQQPQNGWGDSGQQQEQHSEPEHPWGG
jgi:hypothetical protein